MQRSAAKRRWAILSEHLSKKSRAITTPRLPIFHTYGLYDLKKINQDDTGKWFKLKWKERDGWPVVDVRLIDKYRFDVMDLMGFNNTGNIRIWPSEECLTYYLLENRKLFAGKTMLEIGGGMTGLAGISCAFIAAEVIITDGNKKSIENLQLIIDHNKVGDKCQAVFHRWDQPPPDLLVSKQFDLVVAADCFFDPAGHENFIDNLNSFLSPTGVALLFSPERGGSLRCFIEKLFQRNVFNVEQTANICEGITSKISAITASSSTDDFDADKDHVKMLTLQKILPDCDFD